MYCTAGINEASNILEHQCASNLSASKITSCRVQLFPCSWRSPSLWDWQLSAVPYYI